MKLTNLAEHELRILTTKHIRKRPSDTVKNLIKRQVSCEGAMALAEPGSRDMAKTRNEYQRILATLALYETVRYSHPHEVLTQILLELSFADNIAFQDWLTIAQIPACQSASYLLVEYVRYTYELPCFAIAIGGGVLSFDDGLKIIETDIPDWAQAFILTASG